MENYAAAGVQPSREPGPRRALGAAVAAREGASVPGEPGEPWRCPGALVRRGLAAHRLRSSRAGTTPPRLLPPALSLQSAGAGGDPTAGPRGPYLSGGVSSAAGGAAGSVISSAPCGPRGAAGPLRPWRRPGAHIAALPGKGWSGPAPPGSPLPRAPVLPQPRMQTLLRLGRRTPSPGARGARTFLRSCGRILPRPGMQLPAAPLPGCSLPRAAPLEAPSLPPLEPARPGPGRVRAAMHRPLPRPSIHRAPEPRGGGRSCTG